MHNTIKILIQVVLMWFPVFSFENSAVIYVHICMYLDILGYLFKMDALQVYNEGDKVTYFKV